MATKRKIICPLLILVTTLFFGNNLALGDLAHQQPPTLRSASEMDYPPFAIVNPDGTADGFSVELLKAVVKAADLEVRIAVGPWHEIKQQLAEGRLDVLPLVAYSPDRDKIYDFTIPYLQMHGTLFVRKGEKSIQTEADLKDKEVLVMRGDSAHEYAVNQKLSAKLILTDSYEEAMRLLAAGKHDAILCQYLMGAQLIKKLGIKNVVNVGTDHEKTIKLRSKKVSGFEQKFCIAVPEGRKELLSHLNEGLAIVIADGTYERLYDKWFSPIIPPPAFPFATLIKTVIFILLPILFLLAIIGIWYLNRQVRHKTDSLVKEIEERKRIETKILHMHELMHYVISHARSAIAIHDRDLNYIYVSDRYLKDYNVTERNIIGRHHYEIFPDLPQKWRDVHQKGLAGEISSSEADAYLREDGSLVWTRWECRPWYESDGSIGGIIIYTEVITDQIEDKIALQKSQKEWEKTFDAISDIVTIQDMDLRIIRANKAAHNFFKVPPGTLNGKHCYEVFREASQPCQNCPELLTIKELTPHSETIVHANLNKVFNVTSSPIFGENGELHHLIHIAKDITEHKKIEAELFQAHKMEAIGTLAGGIAHDFNNILTAIIGYADMVKVTIPEKSPARQYTDQVLKAGERAKDLVKQILTFSRKGQEAQLTLQPSAIIKEGLKLMRASLPTTINIETEIDADCGSIIANPTGIHQILVNLCTNALHAMEEEQGTLTVKLKKRALQKADLPSEEDFSAGQFVELTVSDTGHGINKNTLPRIFEPYFTTKEIGKGSGMGLALVHGIVQSCGGFINVESSPGKGTTFKLYFPALPEPAAIADPQPQETLPVGSERVLAVDDEKVIVDMYKATLENLGYQVSAYCSSLETLETFLLSPNNFDLIITDQTMPHLPGSELAKKILQIRPDIPIILCTGHSSVISSEKAQEIGIKRFVMKPVTRRTLAFTVREVLDQKDGKDV